MRKSLQNGENKSIIAFNNSQFEEKSNPEASVNYGEMNDLKSAFTVDFEDWYQGFEIFPVESWSQYESRIERNCSRLLEILGSRGIRATFFVLGFLAEKYPHLINAIHNQGHEIGSHGYSHTQIFRLSQSDFDNELKRTGDLVANITGKKPIGFRAPIFSIVDKSSWAMDVLAENGYKYDSSMLPAFNYRYGFVSAKRFYHEIDTARGNKIVEIPVTTARLFKLNLPVGGGAYFRIWPYGVTRWGFNQVLKSGKSGVFYMHPWEIDTEQPRIRLPLRLSFTRYTGLERMEDRLIKLFNDFEFSSMADVFGFDY